MAKTNKKLFAKEDLSYAVGQEVKVVKAKSELPADVSADAIKELKTRGLLEELEVSI